MPSRSWQKLCKRCGLSASEQVTRRDNDGHQITSTRWFHPKLLGTDVPRTTLRLMVRACMGQTVEDLERAVPAIRDAAGAHSARSVVVAPGTLRIELVMREQLATVGHAAPPTAVATTRVTLGRCENGKPWTLPLSGRHTLTLGCSGAGKGSVFWGIAGGLGPAVSAGVVRLVGIDLKYGIELSVGSALFTKIAATESDAVETLAALEKLMNKRGNAMAGRTREHSPTKASPLVVLLIDELAGVTAYMSDPALRKEAAASLSRILTKGCAGNRGGRVPSRPTQGSSTDARAVHPDHRASTAIPRRSNDGPRRRHGRQSTRAPNQPREAWHRLCHRGGRPGNKGAS